MSGDEEVRVTHSSGKAVLVVSGEAVRSWIVSRQAGLSLSTKTMSCSLFNAPSYGGCSGPRTAPHLTKTWMANDKSLRPCAGRGGYLRGWRVHRLAMEVFSCVSDVVGLQGL